MAEIRFEEIFKSLKEQMTLLKKETGQIGKNISTAEMSELVKLTKELTGVNTQLTANQKERIKIEKQKAAQDLKVKNSLDIELQTKKELLKLDQKITREKAQLAAQEARYGAAQKGSINHLKQQQKELTILRNNLSTTSAKYKELTARLAGVNVALQKTAMQSKAGLPGIVSYNSAIGKGIGKLKEYATGMLGIAAVFMAVRKVLQTGKEYIELAKEQLIAETKLATVLKERTNATNDQIESILELTRVQQKNGVIGDEVQIAGAQQFATFVKQTSSVKTLIPALNNLLAQQKGLNATQADAVNIANLAGRAFQGQLGSLTRVGISFSEAEGKILKYGNEQERAAALAEIITNNVGNMNEELAKTPLGKMQQMNNEIGDIKEQIGKGLIPIMVAFKSISLESMKSFKEFFDELSGQINDTILIYTVYFKSLTGIFGEFKKINDETAEKLEKFKSVLKSLTNPLRAIFKWNTIVLKGYKEILRFLGLIESKEALRSGNIKKRVDELTASFKALSLEQKQGVVNEFNKLNAEFKAGKVPIMEYADRLNAIILKAGETKKEREKGNEVLEDTNTELDKILANLLAIETAALSKKPEILPDKVKSDVSNTLGNVADEATDKLIKSSTQALFNSSENAVKTIAPLWKRKITAYFDQFVNGEGSVLGKLLGGGENSEQAAQAIIGTWERLTNVIVTALAQELDQLDELASKQDDAIKKTQDLLDAELKSIDELKSAGAAYDMTQANFLKDKLKREEAARNKTLEAEKQVRLKQQRMQIAQANMDIASAILSIWQGTGHWAIKLAQTIAFSALGAVQLSQIKSQKFAEGGWVHGASHANGGVDITREAEGGEFIVKKKYAPSSKSLLEMINSGIINDHNFNNSVISNIDLNGTNQHLSKIEKNTRKDKIYGVDGKLKSKIIGNMTIHYA